MKSLFGRVMIASLVAVAVFAAVTIAAVGSTLGVSLDDWAQLREADIRESVGVGLRRAFGRTSRPTSSEIEDALEGYLRPGIYVAVFTSTLEPLFVYRPDMMQQGRMLGAAAETTQPAGEPANGSAREIPMRPELGLRRHGAVRGPAQSAPPIEELTPVRVSGNTVGYFVAGSQGFTADAANRRLIRTLLVAVLAGTAAALALSAGASYMFSRRLAGEARGLADGLREIENGSRLVAFEESGSTELVQIAHSADSLQRELVHQEELRNQWAQDVAHDLRTPVAALRSQLEAMADGVLSPTSERLTRALSELGRLETLIADLRTLTQLESPELTLDRRPVDLRELILGATERFALIAEKRGITIDTVCDPLSAEVDSARLDRALSNLIGNAVQYSPDGSTVSVRLERSDRGRPGAAGKAESAGSPNVAIHIENSGTIADSEISRLFDRLYRGETSRTSPGSGLGLTISQEIVKRHNGDISVQNLPGARVRFSVTLPASSR